MGNECCGKDYDTERIINEIEEFDKMAAFKRKSNRRRIGQPSSHFAHRLDKTEETEESLLRYKNNQRKFKKATRIDIETCVENRIDEVFYLTQESGYYIGEWVFDEDVGDNVPEGVGKLYQRKFISEGEIQTEVLKGVGAVTLRTYLNGKGRKYNQTECMEGEFIKGKLWGRGIYTIKEPNNPDDSWEENTVHGNQLSYSYEGIWVDGERHGQGNEETDTYSYCGDFVQDVRQGNGSYISKIDREKTNKVRREEEGYRDKIKEVMNEEQNNRDQRKRLEEEKKGREEEIGLILSKYPWSNPFSSDSLFDHPDFIRERKIRTVYNESYNGEFSANEFHGKGTYRWYSGKIYTGKWVEGEMQGIGEFAWPDGTIYRGTYKNDKRHGKGQMIWCDIRRWRGSWAFGLRHGYGEAVCIDAEYKLLTIEGALWNKNKIEKIFFSKTHDMRTGYLRSDPEDDLLIGDQLLPESEQDVEDNNPAGIVENSRSMVLGQKPPEFIKQSSNSKQYGTESTWMRVNIFDIMPDKSKEETLSSDNRKARKLGESKKINQSKKSQPTAL